MILGLGASLPALTLAVLAVVGPSEEFQRGRTAFLRGEYERAIVTIHPLLYPDLRLESEEAVVQAHRLLGVSYLFTQKPDLARKEFRKLLELAPDFRFDPLLDSPAVVDFFNEVLREQQSELGDIEGRLRKREAQLAKRKVQIVERRIEHHSFGLNFVPFGVGQFQNRQRTKGWIFFGVEAAMATTSIGALVTNFALYGVRPQRACLDKPDPMLPPPAVYMCPTEKIDHSSDETSRTLTRVQVISGGVFFAAAIWGVIDALRNFQSEVTVGETFAAPPPATTSLRFVPLLTPSVHGAAAALTF